MKNKIQLFGIAILFMAIVISFSACGGSGAGSPAAVDETEGEGPGGDGTEITPIAVTGVTIKTQTALLIGRTETLIAAIEPVDATNKTVTWSSSNTSIATVSRDGLVTGVGLGTATITAKTIDGDKTASCTFTIDSFINVYPFFKAWLEAQPNNTIETAYNIKLRMWNDDIGSLLFRNPNKYVYVDLSPTTYWNKNLITDVPLFSSVTSLIGITLPSRITKIDDETFLNCTNLKSINIPNGVTYIGVDAFKGCTSPSLTTLNIQGGTIKESAFEGCTSLTSVTIQSGDIGYGAFTGCTNLASLTLGNGVTRIGCGLYYNYPDERASTMTGAFQNCTSLTNVTIQSGNIGFNAFSGCTRLASVTLGNGVTRIEDGAFQNCSSLASVIIPNSVTRIGTNTYTDYSGTINYRGSFRGCTSLTSITIPNSVNYIGSYVFFDCSSLASVTLGTGITNIGFAAFQNCSSLNSVTFQGTIPKGYTLSPSLNFDTFVGFKQAAFWGDLDTKFYATDADKGTPGTYTTTAPVSSSSVWTKL